jgi:hypothetical protein
MNIAILSTILGGTYAISAIVLVHFFGPKKKQPPKD